MRRKAWRGGGQQEHTADHSLSPRKLGGLTDTRVSLEALKAHSQ